MEKLKVMENDLLNIQRIIQKILIIKIIYLFIIFLNGNKLRHSEFFI